jgi:hypothetical protein
MWDAQGSTGGSRTQKYDLKDHPGKQHAIFRNRKQHKFTKIKHKPINSITFVPEFNGR